MDLAMTSIDEFKSILLEAEKLANEPENDFHQSARVIVNIERQSFYGDESERARLKKIREEISTAVTKRT